MDVYDKFAMFFFIICIIIAIAIIGLCGWGFIELIQWITSK